MPNFNLSLTVDYIWTFLIAISEQKALVILTLENEEANQKETIYISIFTKRLLPSILYERDKFWGFPIYILYIMSFTREYISIHVTLKIKYWKGKEV